MTEQEKSGEVSSGSAGDDSQAELLAESLERLKLLRRYETLFNALVALEQAYSNKHSPQHRLATLAEARSVIAAMGSAE